MILTWTCLPTVPVAVGTSWGNRRVPRTTVAGNHNVDLQRITDCAVRELGGLSSELTDVFTTLEGYDDGAIEAPVRIESRVRRP